MPDKLQLHELIDRLPESELPAATRYLEFLLVREAPVDPDMLARIRQAREHRSSGTAHEEVLKEFGL